VKHWLALAAAALGIGTLTPPVAGQDWTGWRGAERDGASVGFELPDPLPGKLQLAWQVDVGLGHASPLLVGDRLFVWARQGDQEVLSARRLADGSVVWSQQYPAPYKVNPVAAGHGPGPKATPIVHQGKVFTLGISGILSGWDAAGGRRLWQHDFADRFAATSPLYGAANSPLALGSRCVAYVGGHDRGALVAVGAADGALSWVWDGDGPGYTSAVAAGREGDLLITQSQAACVGIAASNGQLRWRIPYKTDYDQNSVTPVVVGQRVIFSGINRGLQCYRLDGPQPQLVWENSEVSCYMSTPVVLGERLVAFSHRKKGQLAVIHLADGKTQWLGDGRQGDNAALVRTGDRVWMLATTGRLSAWKAQAAGLVRLAEYEVASTPTWAHPLLTREGVVIKDESRLALWRWQ
jgi:outer membrane protein assembly factor BamB